MITLLLAVIYLAFIGLGLPDSLLGAAWPAIYRDLDAPFSFAGVLATIISAGTIVSSLNTDRLTKALGTGRVTAFSVGLTAIALFGFSFSDSLWLLCLWAIPYGLGAGSVDAAINNYVAVNFKSQHMSWLHCMWGVGAALGPYLMGTALAHGHSWTTGYQLVGALQVALTAILFASLPLWSRKKMQDDAAAGLAETQVLSLRQVLSLPGAKPLGLCFFCYCALEQTAILWGSSYLSLAQGFSTEAAATFASIFLLGITVGRALSGFLALKIHDHAMIRLGQAFIALGLLALVLPFGQAVTLGGLLLMGLGCAPIYPSIIHAIPALFGAEKSQAVTGVQMASAYLGPLTMPPLFGLLANHLTVAIFPAFMAVLLVLMVLMHERIMRNKKPSGGF